MADKKLKNLPQSYSYGIYEVYYTNDKPTSWSSEPMHAIGETWNELHEDYHRMFEAFCKKPLILENGKLKEGKMFQ